MEHRGGQYTRKIKWYTPLRGLYMDGIAWEECYKRRGLRMKDEIHVEGITINEGNYAKMEPAAPAHE